MKNTTLIIVILLIIIAGGFFMFGKSSSNSSSLSQSQESGDAQKITLSMKNSNYYPNTIKVKANQPVEITLDKSVAGCYRAFTINALGVSKYSTDSNDKVIFTPSEKGTFSFACTMGMGRGTIVVE